MTKILIVDDENNIRSLLKRLLEKNGYTCILASNAGEAKGILEDEGFDLILCDIQMPGESGIDLARHVISKYPDTAVVMVTVIDSQETAKAVLEMSVYGYLLKPFDANQLLISVANALRRRDLEIWQRSFQQYLEQAVRERTAEISRMNDALLKRENELTAQKKDLEDLNSAMRVLLRKEEEDKAALEENILATIKATVEPFLDMMKKTPLKNEQKEILNILESNIKDITTSFIRELSSAHLALSPTEIQVANLIKQGKSTKKIADLLHLSVNTVMSHRYNIRRKLGLLNKDTNLQTFLSSLR